MNTSASVTISPEDVKALRDRRGWTQIKFAEELNVSQATISKIENGAPIEGALLRLLTMMIEQDAKKAARRRS